MTYKSGDVVHLKSGGPAMTVEKVARLGFRERVFCIWFENNEHRRGNFAPATLELESGVQMGRRPEAPHVGPIAG